MSDLCGNRICGHPRSSHRSGGLCEDCIPVGDATGARSDCQMFVEERRALKSAWSPTAETNRCADVLDVLATDAADLDMTAVSDLLCNVRDALRLGLGPAATLAHLRREHEAKGPSADFRPVKRHLPLRVWQEKPGEFSWECSCGMRHKHMPLSVDEKDVELRCVDDELNPVATEPGCLADTITDAGLAFERGEEMS